MNWERFGVICLFMGLMFFMIQSLYLYNHIEKRVHILEQKVNHIAVFLKIQWK